MLHNMLFSEMNSHNTEVTATGRGRKSQIFVVGCKRGTTAQVISIYLEEVVTFYFMNS